MSIDIRIADVQVSIKGRDFFNALNPIERELLNPFIVKRPANIGNYVIVDAKCVDDFNAARKYNADSESIKFIKDQFFYKDDERFESFFKNFVNESLMPYLWENALNQKNPEVLLKDGGCARNRIIIKKDSFVIYNESGRCYELIHRKTNHLSEGHFLWPHSLVSLRLLFRMILNSKKDGIILHASSIEQDGNGYVFVGPSNSGKSTVAKILEPDRILSDDMTVIRRAEKVYKIYPNPWWNGRGKFSIKYPESPAKLKAIFFIEKSEKTSMKKLNYKEALGTLIYGDGSFQQTGFFDNKEGVKAFYLFAKELISNIPSFSLSIKKDQEFKEEFYRLTTHYLKR